MSSLNLAKPAKPARVLILGTGIAGLSAALKFADSAAHPEVTLVCKSEASDGATRWAQGGIASVWSKQDSFEQHKQDTLVAGAGLCNEAIVELTVREGPARVQELIDLGVEFTRAEGVRHEGADPAEIFDLHREGGHGQRRILHADDLTGLAIEKALLEKVRAHPRIRVLEHHIAVDLITEGKVFKRWRKSGPCLGAYVLEIATEKVHTIAADVTVLATGGAGKVYLYTSNPDIATGDGIAMAYRAGAKIANLEFMQFHPTCLYHPGAQTFLVTEALRGEGAVLKTRTGEEFMSRYHAQASLAPRDVVARGIDAEMKRTGDKHVLLDCTHMSEEEFAKKFPHINETCHRLGIDSPRQPLPVVPAQHYTCGGVLVNEHGQTTIENLYAVGEVACTGLHGANRLASNSLLEAVVFAHRTVEHAEAKLASCRQTPSSTDASLPAGLPEWDSHHAVEIEEQIDIAANWLEIRHIMWNFVGIVRSNRRLERAKRRLDILQAEVNNYYWGFLLTKDLIELRNLLLVADLIVQSAMLRKESRGLHYTVDYPARDDQHFRGDTVLVR
jgi:L-aspartate oxidase